MEMLKVFPFWVFALLALAWHGYLYHDFENSLESPKALKITEIDHLKTAVLGVQKKIEEAKKFEQTLKLKELELKAKIEELQSMSVTLTDEIDIPSFLRIVSSEAKKLGFKIYSIRPSAERLTQYYAYTRIAVEYEAVFVQLIQFLRVLSETQKINRVSEFTIAPVREQEVRLVPLKGVLQIDVFRYLQTEEDKYESTLSPAPKIDPAVPQKKGAHLSLPYRVGELR